MDDEHELEKARITFFIKKDRFYKGIAMCKRLISLIITTRPRSVSNTDKGFRIWVRLNYGFKL